MWTFLKLVDCCDKFCKPLEYPWVLKIASPLELIVYEAETSGRYSEAFSNLINSREFQELTCIPGPLRDHMTNMTSWALLIRLKRKEGQRVSVVQEVQDFVNEVHDDRINSIEKYGAIYIQEVGSYFFPSKTHKIIQEKVSKELVFPEGGEARFLQWPNGKHWYVKIGDVDVRVNGNSKWDSKEKAEKALARFLRKK